MCIECRESQRLLSRKTSASNAKCCITLLCLPLKKKNQAIQMTYLAHSINARCSSLPSAFPEKLSAALFIFRSIHPRQKSFSVLSSRSFWFPPKVYSVYALFTKVTKAKGFPRLLTLNKQFYQLLRPPGCSLSVTML